MKRANGEGHCIMIKKEDIGGQLLPSLMAKRKDFLLKKIEI